MKTVTEMARESGFIGHEDSFYTNHRYGDCKLELERFAELVRADAIADEREACAVIAETASDYLQNSTFEGVAAAIRSRSSEH